MLWTQDEEKACLAGGSNSRTQVTVYPDLPWRYLETTQNLYKLTAAGIRQILSCSQPSVGALFPKDSAFNAKSICVSSVCRSG